MDTLDCPDASQLTPGAERVGDRAAGAGDARTTGSSSARASTSPSGWRQRARATSTARSTRLYRLALGRAADGRRESTALAAYAPKHGLANACRLLFNSNEFMFVTIEQCGTSTARCDRSRQR